jgi:hypothetical protein
VIASVLRFPQPSASRGALGSTRIDSGRARGRALLRTRHDTAAFCDRDRRGSRRPATPFAGPAETSGSHIPSWRKAGRPDVGRSACRQPVRRIRPGNDLLRGWHGKGDVERLRHELADHSDHRLAANILNLPASVVGHFVPARSTWRHLPDRDAEGEGQ